MGTKSGSSCWAWLRRAKKSAFPSGPILYIFRKVGMHCNFQCLRFMQPTIATGSTIKPLRPLSCYLPLPATPALSPSLLATPATSSGSCVRLWPPVQGTARRGSRCRSWPRTTAPPPPLARLLLRRGRCAAASVGGEGEEPPKCWFQKILVPKILQHFGKCWQNNIKC
jgi:hypothetical protein